jgi:hypothetical protein
VILVDLDSILQPDDIVEEYLVKIFGPAALIVIIFKLYVIAKSWLDLAIAGHDRAVEAGSTLRRIVTNGLQSRFGVVWSIVGAAILLALWIVLSYTMGNGASYLAFGNIPLSGPRLAPFLSWRRDDLVYEYVFQGSILLVVLSVLLAFKGKSAIAVAWLLAAPWFLFACLMGLFTVVSGIGAIVNFSHGMQFSVDIYGVQVNPMVYLVLGVTALGYSWITLIIADVPLKVREVVKEAAGPVGW